MMVAINQTTKTERTTVVRMSLRELHELLQEHYPKALEGLENVTPKIGVNPHTDELVVNYNDDIATNELLHDDGDDSSANVFTTTESPVTTEELKG